MFWQVYFDLNDFYAFTVTLKHYTTTGRCVLDSMDIDSPYRILIIPLVMHFNVVGKHISCFSGKISFYRVKPF